MTQPPEDQSRIGLRVLFMGTPAAAVPTLKALHASGVPIPLVVTRPDRPRGRGKTLSPCPVKEAAIELSLPVFQPENVNLEESVERLRAAEADVLLIVAYGRILAQRVLDVPRLLPLNTHFSLLPEFRGAAPVAAAIARGRTETGVTIQRVVRKLDAGPILAASRVRIEPGERAGDLEARLAVVGADLAVRTLRRIERGETAETPQDETKATFAPRLAKADGDVDFSRPAAEIESHVRAMHPWPGAHAVFRGEARGRAIAVEFLEVAVREDGSGEPGEVVAVDRDEIVVAAGRGRLAIRRLKPSGRKEQAAAAFVNGYAVRVGDCFQSPVRSS